MNIHELRIWNYVLFCKAESIITSINNNDEENPYVDLASYDNIPIEDLHPIPLTEEWFMKFGFERFGINFRLNNFEYNPVTKNIIVHTGGAYYNGITLRVECIHKLQNLYFALTGEELIIK